MNTKMKTEIKTNMGTAMQILMTTKMKTTMKTSKNKMNSFCLLTDAQFEKESASHSSTVYLVYKDTAKCFFYQFELH